MHTKSSDDMPSTGQQKPSNPAMDKARETASNVATSVSDAAAYVGHKAEDAATSLGEVLESTANYVKKQMDSGVKIVTLHDFYVEELRDLHNAENQLLKVIPKMAKAATSLELRRAFEEHFDETRIHVQRLETIFQELATSPQGKRCKAMEGIIAEAEETLNRDMPAAVKDAALIAATQRMEHYEIAGYGCVRTYARILNHPNAEALLDTTLQEEGASDHRLTAIAEGTVNDEAAIGDIDL